MKVTCFWVRGIQPRKKTIRQPLCVHVSVLRLGDTICILDWQNHKLPITCVQRTRPTFADHSAAPTWNECYPNDVQSHASNRSTTNAGSASINLCLVGRYDRQRTLVIRIAAITLASHLVITIARFCPSKICMEGPGFASTCLNRDQKTLTASWKGAKGIPTKGEGETPLKVMNSRYLQDVWGCFPEF